MIEPHHIEAASQRWEDFQSVNCQPEPEWIAEARERIEEGEKAADVLLEIKERYDGENIADALANLQLGLGLSREAMRAFYEAAAEHEPSPFLSREEAVDQATMNGLILGLIARELAAECSGSPGTEQG